MINKKLLAGGATGAIAACLFAATPAFAAGTLADTNIINSVSVTYEVNGVEQAPETATDDVEVDRKIDLTVARVDNTPTAASPGQTPGGTGAASVGAVTFTVTNDSNATLDFALDADNVASGAIAGLGTDNFDVNDPSGSFIIYADDGGTVGAWDAGDSVITHLDALAPDTPTTVHVRASVPTTAPDGGLAGIELTATARESDNGAAVGSTLPTAAATNTAGVDTVYADADNDGIEAAIDAYSVDTAEITVAKSSKVVASPIAGDTSGTYIPGATVEYCILVTNASTTVAATSVAISDNISALPLTFVSGNLPGETNNVAVGGADCDTYGTTGGSESSGVVTGTITSVPTGTSRSVIFRATID